MSPRPLLPWEACGWREAEANTSADCLPFSCQVITRKVNIQVGDVNDNAPTFHNQPYSVRIPEVGALGPDLGPSAATCCARATWE